jgi:hypothetical protein
MPDNEQTQLYYPMVMYWSPVDHDMVLMPFWLLKHGIQIQELVWSVHLLLSIVGIILPQYW